MEKKWFNQEIEDVEKNLKTDLKNGLTTEEVKGRQEENGFNELKEGKKKNLFQKFIEQF